MPKANVKVSVIIPTWNRGTLLKEAVLSALNQSESSLEVLVCDDGSTDNSRELVEKIADPRVRWLPGNHHGRPAQARNSGIREAAGEWIAFLDSDDKWQPEKLERQLRAADSLDVKAVSSNAARYIPKSNEMAGPLLSYHKDRITLDDLLNSNWVICSSMLVHSSILSRAGSFPEHARFRAIEDYALWLRVASLTDIAYIPELLIQYRDNPKESIRGTKSLETSELTKLIIGNYLRWCLRTNRRQLLTNHLQAARLWLWASCSSSLNRFKKKWVIS